MSAKSKIILNVMTYIKDEKLKKELENLTQEEIKVLEYFIQNVSVGVIVAIRELKSLYKVEDPKNVIRKLIEKGLLEQGYGNYSLARSLRETLLSIILASRT
jgi:DNA-binding MarR family transcriptional regulator